MLFEQLLNLIEQLLYLIKSLNLLEVENFGINAITISSAATLFFTYILSKVWYRQGKNIWSIRDKESGKTMPNITVIIILYQHISILILGWEKHGLAMVINGFLFTLILYALIGLVVKVGFKTGDWVILASGVFPLVLMPSLDIVQMQLVVLIFFLINQFFLIKMPLAMRRFKSSGVVRKDLLWIYLASSAFWFIYYSATKFWIIAAALPIAIAILSWTLILWYRYSAVQIEK